MPSVSETKPSAAPAAGTRAEAAPRIVRIITRLNIGGPSIQAARLTTLLEARGFHTRLVYGRLGPEEGDMSDLVAGHRDVSFLPTLQRPIAPLDDLRTLIILWRELRAFRPAIVHTHMAKAGLLGRLATVLYNATRGSAPRARLLHTYHGHVLEGYFTPLLSRTFIVLERLLARVSDRLVAISPTIGRELHEVHGIGNTSQYRVIPLGFELDRFLRIDARARADARLVLALAPDAEVVSQVGRLTAIKQPQLFLQVLAALARSRPQLHAVIAGDGELRGELQQLTKTFGLEQRVRWLGWRRDLETIYAATDVLVLTSRNEGTPVALIEAMAAGVPGVSTDVGGVRDVIDSPAVGVLAPPNDVSGLASGVERLLNDVSGRREMGQRARARVVQKYGVERLLMDIERLYRELLDRD